MRINSTRERLRAGEVVFGLAVQQIRSPEIPRILAAAGFDYLFVDTEHGGFDIETVQDLVSAANQAGITPFVRVCELRYSLVARALDVGAQGVIFPRVEDPDLLREAIGWTKFPPAGTRGFGVSPPLLDYQTRSLPEVIEHFNAQTMSISLGVPGQFEHPRMVAVIEQFVAACARHGVTPGIHSRAPALAKAWPRRGMRLVGCGGEITLLLERAHNVVAEMRGVAAEAATA